MREAACFDADWGRLCMPRLGLAALTRMAFQRVDLHPLWTELMEKVTDDAPGAGMGMDLSVIAQLRGDKPLGLAIQRDSLKLHQIFRCEAHRQSEPPRLRLLALAAASDIGANTPVEFLLKDSGIDLATLYMGAEVPVPPQLPAHDLAIVLASAEASDALAAIENFTKNWRVPLLNPPERIRELGRDRLYRNLADIPGLQIPPTSRHSRESIQQALLEFPVIIRPIGSHAGFGLSKIDDATQLCAYLAARKEENFFVSPFVDYAGPDGLYRKYRVALIGERAFPVHMAVAEEWKVWYLNADMALSPAHRLEEADFLHGFATGFGSRHQAALTQMAERIGLDYVLVDCAETRDGALLIFEADHCAIVHDMDPVSLYPYKPPAMQRLFSAFATLLMERAASAHAV